MKQLAWVEPKVSYDLESVGANRKKKEDEDGERERERRGGRLMMMNEKWPSSYASKHSTRFGRPNGNSRAGNSYGICLRETQNHTLWSKIQLEEEVWNAPILFTYSNEHKNTNTLYTG